MGNFRNKLIAFVLSVIVSMIGCCMVHNYFALVFLLARPEYSFTITASIAYFVLGGVIGRISEKIKVILVCTFITIAQLYFSNSLYEDDALRFSSRNVLPISDWQNIKILFAMIAIFSSTCGGYISQNAFKKGTACCNFRNKLIAAAQNMWPASIDFRAFRRAAIVSLVGCWMVHCSLAEVLRWEPFMIPSPEYSGEFFPFIIITAIAYLISGYMIGRLSREIKIFLICVFTIIAQLYFANIVYEYDVSTLGQAHVASISTWWATRINFITVATLASICGVYIGQNTRRSGTGYYNFRNKMFHSPFFWWVAGSFGIFGYRGSNIYRCGMNAYGLFIEWMPILFILILLVLIVRRKKEEKFIDIFRRGLSRWGWTVLVCFLWAMYVGDYSMSPCCAPEEHCVG